MPLFRVDMTTRGKMVSGADPGLERVLVENRGISEPFCNSTVS